MATDTLVPVLALPEAARHGEEGLSIAREIGWRAGEAFAHFNLAFCYAAQGEYSRALSSARASREIAEEIGHRQWIAGANWTLGTVYLDLLDPLAARQHLEQALALAREIGSTHWIRFSSGFLAMAHLAQGDLERAAEVLDAALAFDAAADTLGQRLVWCARAELALARGDPGAAQEIVDRLLASPANAIPSHGSPRVLRLRGAALAATGAPEATTALDEARHWAEAQGARPQTWRAHAALGFQLRALGRRADAEREFAAARAIVRELADDVSDEPVRERFLLAAGADDPGTATPDATEGSQGSIRRLDGAGA